MLSLLFGFSDLNFPAELLNNILRAVQDLYRGEPDREWIRWLDLLRVCRRWNSVITGDPFFWTEIHPAYLGLTHGLAAILSRSRGLPLGVQLRDVNESNFPKFALVMREMTRIRSLELNVLHYYVSKLRRELPDAERDVFCPLVLERLSLQIFHGVLHNSPMGLSDVFSGGFPCLQELDLSCDWDMDGIIPAPTLRKLTVSIIGDVRRDHPLHKASVDPKNLVESLRMMPLLQNLRLHHPCTRPRFGELINLPPVVLPALNSFSLTSGLFGAIQTVARIALPPTCSYVSLELDTSVGGPFSVPEFVQYMHRWADKLRSGDRQARPVALSLFGTSSAPGNQHFFLEVCPHRERSACPHAADDDPACAESLFFLYISGKPYNEHVNAALLSVVPFAEDVRVINIVGSPAAFPSHPIVSDRSAHDLLMARLKRFAAVEKMGIVRGALAYPIDEGGMRRLLPGLRDIVFSDPPLAEENEASAGW